MARKTRVIMITNTATGTVWIYRGLKETSKELHIDSSWINDYCNGKKRFFNNVYKWEFVEDGGGNSHE